MVSTVNKYFHKYEKYKAGKPNVGQTRLGLLRARSGFRGITPPQRPKYFCCQYNYRRLNISENQNLKNRKLKRKRKQKRKRGNLRGGREAPSL